MISIISAISLATIGSIELLLLIESASVDELIVFIGASFAEYIFQIRDEMAALGENQYELQGAVDQLRSDMTKEFKNVYKYIESVVTDIQSYISDRGLF